jgi:hypothetical protein
MSITSTEMLLTSAIAVSRNLVGSVYQRGKCPLARMTETLM